MDIIEAWRATLRARASDRVYLTLVAAAFILGVVDSVTSGTLATVTGMALLVAAGTAAGVARQPHGVIGRLLGVLTISCAFCALLLATSALIGRPPESAVREGVTALSGVVWITALVFLLSTFLPRRLDAVVAVVVSFAGPVLYHMRTQFAHATAARVVEAVWENVGLLVVVSDASPGVNARADVARLATNVAIAIAAGMLIAYWRSPSVSTDPRASRVKRWLPAAAAVAIGARLLVPGAADRVEWIQFGESTARVEPGRRPVLYYFAADWCAICDRLEHDLFAEPRDASWINEGFVAVRVLDRKREDGRNNQAVEQLREQFGIEGFPTLVVVGQDGKLRTRVVGYSGNLTEVRQVLRQSLDGRQQ